MKAFFIKLRDGLAKAGGILLNGIAFVLRKIVAFLGRIRSGFLRFTAAARVKLPVWISRGKAKQGVALEPDPAVVATYAPKEPREPSPVAEGSKKQLSRFGQWLRENGKKPFLKAGGLIKRYKLISALCALACVLLVLCISLIPPALEQQRLDEKIARIQESLTLNADLYETDKAVYIEGAADLTLDEIEDNLTILPKANYSVVSMPGGSYKIEITDKERRSYYVSLREPYSQSRYNVRLESPLTELAVKSSNLNAQNHQVDEPIGLTFSDEVRREELMRFLFVEPYFDFDITMEDNTAWITPAYNLDFNKDYIIFLEAGLTSVGGNVLEENKTIEFKTQREAFSIRFANPLTRLMGTQDDLNLNFVTVLEGIESVPVIIELYRFPSWEHYLKQAETLVVYQQVDLSPLDREDILVRNLVDGTNEIILPDLETGPYMMRATVTNPRTGELYEYRKAFGVTDLSVYAQTSDIQTLVWANNGATGQALAGYTVEFFQYGTRDSMFTAETDADGIAIFDYIDYYEGFEVDEYGVIRATSSQANKVTGRYTYYAEVMALRDADGEIVYVDNTAILNQYVSSKPRNRYYTFLHTDRTLYKPTDELNFWGYLRGYHANPEPNPETVTVILGEGSLDLSMEVEIGPDGTYMGTLPLEAVRSSNYSLSAKVDTGEVNEEGDAVFSTVSYESIQIKEYEKPAFVITTSVDKEYYLPGEEVQLTIEPTFYDGTPMPNYDLEVMVYDGYYGNTLSASTVTTGDDGLAVYTFAGYQRPKDSATGWAPIRNRYLVRITEDGENISTYGSYVYFPTNIMLSSDVQLLDNGRLQINLGANAIDLSTINSASIVEQYISTNYYNDTTSTTMGAQYDVLKGEPVTVTASLNLEYSYRNEENKLISNTRKVDVEIKDGVGTLNDAIEMVVGEEQYINVYATIQAKDSLGRLVTGRDYWSHGRQEIYVDETDNYPPAGYTLLVTDSEGENVMDEYRRYRAYNEASFGAGEDMNFTLLYKGEPTENTGKILYTIIQGDIAGRGFVTGTDTFTLVQNIDNANSFNLVAAYFDGTTVHPIRNTLINFDKKSIELDVEVTPTQETYMPGDSVTLQVRVTDRNGNGVASSTIVGIVDEAVFALREQSVDVLTDLYQNFYWSHYGIKKYTTTLGDATYDGAGSGGKDSGDNLQFLDSLRKNFKDTALFQSVRTDSAGNATITFTLPDNVTTWRITSASISDGLFGGQSKSNFISTQPFFMRPVVSTKYIEGDDIAVLVQGHGIILDAETNINYTVRITGDNVDETRSLSNTAFQTNEVNFGKLAEGEYLLSATAQTGNYRDTVELPVYVISSNLELVISKVVSLDELPEINAVRYPVTVSFYDREHEGYFSSISSMLHHYCMGANQRMSRFVAKRALSQFMEPDDIPQYIRAGSNDVASDMQNSDGGIGFYVGSESDPVLTAKVLIVARDQFNLQTMAAYFRRQVEENRNQVELAASYLGLAVIGEDVLDDIHTQLLKPRISDQQRMYLITALAYLEETEEADALYEEHITPNLVGSGSGKYYRTTGDNRERDSLTAAAWIAASMINQDDADAISIFFAKNSWRIDTLFECMIYVTNYNKEVTPGTVSYTVNGRTVNLDLGLRGQRSVKFNKSEFETLAFGDIPENIVARAYFIGEPDEVDIDPSEAVSIKKELVSMGNDRYRIMLTIDFNEDAPTGNYDISDWVPSNLRLYSMDKTNYGSYAADRGWYYSYTTEGQKLYFTINRQTTQAKQVRLFYTAKKTFEAQAMMDSAYIIHGDTGINNYTERQPLQ